MLLTHLPDGVINGWLLSSLSFLAIDLPQKCLCVCACMWGKGECQISSRLVLFSYNLRNKQTLVVQVFNGCCYNFLLDEPQWLILLGLVFLKKCSRKTVRSVFSKTYLPSKFKWKIIVSKKIWFSFTKFSISKAF